MAAPANAAPSCMRPRASRSLGSVSTRGSASKHSRNASCEYMALSVVRFRVTAVSTACESASMPVSAVTRGGWLMVSSGSRIAMRAAIFGSRHAIF